MATNEITLDAAHSAHFPHKNVRLAILGYSGTMNFFGYCNGSEFMAVTLDDAAIPIDAPKTTAVEDYAFRRSEIQHEADVFIGNGIVHGDGKVLDDQINAIFQSWWDSVRSRFLHLKYIGQSAYPPFSRSGLNKFDISIANFSSVSTCTFAIQSVDGSGNVKNLIVRELNGTTPGYGYKIILA